MVLNTARRADITFIPSVIVHVDHKMIGFTKGVSTDSALVGQAVHVHVQY